MKASGAFACVAAGLLLAAPEATARLAVVATGKGRAAIVDLSAKRVVARPWVGLRSRAVALTVDGMRAYVASGNGTSGRLGVVDLSTRTVIARVPLPDSPSGIALSPDDARAYVAAGGSSGRLVVVDLSTNAVAAEIATPPRPGAVAVSPDGTRAFVTYGRRGLAIVDLSRHRILKRLRVGRNPSDVAVHPSGRRVYVLEVCPRFVPFAQEAAKAIVPPVDPAGISRIVGKVEPGRIQLDVRVIEGEHGRGITTGCGFVHAPDGLNVFFRHRCSCRPVT